MTAAQRWPFVELPEFPELPLILSGAGAYI
jgi:hypothetical protein